MLLSIIIVNYNVKYFVEQCLHAVLNATKNIDAEIIMVDNNSTDGSNNYLKNKFANVSFIWSPENTGFSKANNIALEHATGKYILFLNPDTIIAADCLEKCVSFFDSKYDIGALGVRMIDGAGKYLKESKRGFPSPLTSFFKLSGLAAVFPNSRLFARYYLGHLPENENNYIDVLAGAFMMVKKEILDIIGGFDEAFFMYGEDIDLSYRIQKAGYKNYYFTETTIIHFKGESTKRNTVKYVQIFYGAMSFFVKKHYRGTGATFYTFFINIAIGLKAITHVIKKLFSFKSNVNTTNASSPLCTIIVASEEDALQVNNIINEAGAKLKILGRVDPTLKVSNNSLGNYNQLQQVIRQHKIDNIIFCIRELTVKETIECLQNIKLPVSYNFHFAGSSSIVGSNNKNTSGKFIAGALKQ